MTDQSKIPEEFRLKPPKPSSPKSISMKLSHAKRRALGIPLPSRQSHDRLCAFLKPKK